MERACPTCQSNGRHQLLELRQINLTTATYMCKFDGCTYPDGYSWIYVSRNVCDVSDNDSDSDSGILDYDDISSIVSGDTNSVITNTCDVSQCRIDTDRSLTDPVTLGQCSLNNSSSKDNSVKLLSSNAQVDISVSNDILINTVECGKNGLNLSVNLANSSVASSNSKSTIDVTTEDSNDNINVDISQSKDANLESNNVSNETSNAPTCKIKITLLDTCTEVLDIANIPIVLADSEEGKKLLESINETTVSLPVNTTGKPKIKKLLITKPVKALNRAQQLLKLQSKVNRINSKENISRSDSKQIINTVPEAASKAVLDYRKNEREKLKIIKIIPGKHVSNDLTCSAARFDGFKFKSTIIKPEDVSKRQDAVRDEKKNTTKVELNSSDTKVENMNNITYMKSVNVEVCKESNLEEMALNDFFNNIDQIDPINVADQSLNTDEVDEWLKSLCSYHL